MFLAGAFNVTKASKSGQLMWSFMILYRKIISAMCLRSSRVMKLKINKQNDALTVMLGNNCVAFLFDEIRYELNGVEIDRNRNVGITSTLKNYVSLTSDEDKNMENAGWGLKRRDGLIVKNHFNFCIPLKYLLGFCEDYKRIIINARHELILIRSRNDNNSLIGSPLLEPEIELLKLQWRMPHVTPNDVNKLSLLHTSESGQNLSICFQSWDLYEYPLLQSITKHSWAVEASARLENPCSTADLPHRVQIPPAFLGPGQQPSAGLVTLLTTAWVAGELHECAAVHVGSYHECIAWIRRPLLHGRTLMQFSHKFRNG